MIVKDAKVFPTILVYYVIKKNCYSHTKYVKIYEAKNEPIIMFDLSFVDLLLLWHRNQHHLWTRNQKLGGGVSVGDLH